MGAADGDDSRDCEEIEFTLKHNCVSEATEDITTNDLIADARFPDVLPISAPCRVAFKAQQQTGS